MQSIMRVDFSRRFLPFFSLFWPWRIYDTTWTIYSIPPKAWLYEYTRDTILYCVFGILYMFLRMDLYVYKVRTMM